MVALLIRGPSAHFITGFMQTLNIRIKDGMIVQMDDGPPIELEDGVPLIETRGRPPSVEHAAMKRMKVGQSFPSRKSRDTLYQIAKNVGIEVSVRSAGKQGYRVWKLSDERIPRKSDR